MCPHQTIMQYGQVRAILCGSYVFGFYLQVVLSLHVDSSNLVSQLLLFGSSMLVFPQEEECKGLFEGLQTELEEVTEALAEVIARW